MRVLKISLRGCSKNFCQLKIFLFYLSIFSSFFVWVKNIQDFFEAKRNGLAEGLGKNVTMFVA